MKLPKPSALVSYSSDSDSDSGPDAEPTRSPSSPPSTTVTTATAAPSKKRPAASFPSTSTSDDHDDAQPPLKKANIIRVQAPVLSAADAGKPGLFGGAKPSLSSAGGSGLFAFLPKPANATKPAATSPAAAGGVPAPVTTTEAAAPDAVESTANPTAPGSASWRKLAPPSAVAAAAKSKPAAPKPSSANAPSPPASHSPTVAAAAAPPASAYANATPSAFATQPAVSFFSFDDDEPDTDSAPMLGPSLPTAAPSTHSSYPPAATAPNKPYFTPPTHASPYAYHSDPSTSASASSAAPPPTDLDALARSLGVDRRDLAKLGISSKHTLGSSSVHSISVRDALAGEDLESLAASAKAAAPKPIHEHISSSTKLNIVQLAKKAVTQNSDLQAVFAAQRAKKKSGNTKYGF